jgi:hypothetical protein
MNKVLLTALSIVGFISASLTAPAANLQFEPVYVQAYDASLNPLGTPTSVSVGSYVEFNFGISILDAAPGEDFWRADLSIQPQPELTAVDLFGVGKWMSPATAEAKGLYAAIGYPSPAPALQSYAQYDSNGAAAGGIENHWQIANSDPGNDLVAIDVEAAAAEAANRQYGEMTRPGGGYADQLGSPTLIGTVLFQAISPGFGVGHVSPATPFPSAVSWFGTYEDNESGAGTATNQPPDAYTSTSFGIRVVPEPNSVILASFSVVWLILFSWHKVNRDQQVY